MENCQPMKRLKDKKKNVMLHVQYNLPEDEQNIIETCRIQRKMELKH
jgi:3-phosphoglycerate kinase